MQIQSNGQLNDFGNEAITLLIAEEQLAQFKSIELGEIKRREKPSSGTTKPCAIYSASTEKKYQNITVPAAAIFKISTGWYQIPYPKMNETISQKLVLELYPEDVIEEIVQYAGLNQLIQLLKPQNREFLNCNHHLRHAIDKLIQKSSGKIQFNNRISRPSFLHIYLRIPTFIEKENVHFLQSEQDFIILDQYCRARGLDVTLTIAYFFWTLADIFDFKELISALGDGSGVKYQIDLDFLAGLLYSIKVEVLWRQLKQQCGMSIETIVFTGHEFSSRFYLDYFPNLKALCVGDCREIDFQYMQNSHLEKFALGGDLNRIFNRTNKLELTSLPETLTYLRLGRVKLEDKSRAEPEERERRQDASQLPSLNPVPLKLKTLRFEYSTFSDWEPDDVASILEDQFLQPNVGRLQDFQFVTWRRNERFAPVVANQQFDRDLIKLFNKVICKDLHSLDLTLPSRDLTLCLENFPTLQKLTIRAQGNSEILNQLQFPETLEKLDLSDNGIVDFSSIDKSLPLNLKMLDLSDNPINWSTYTPAFDKLQKLRKLRLFNTHIGSNIDKISFPDSIEQLSLEVNQIQSIDEVRFPKNLSNLGIGSNKLSTVYKPHFPASLKTLHLTENLLRKVDLHEFQFQNRTACRIEILYLNYNRLSNVSNLQLPQTLKILNLDGCEIKAISGVEFAPSIEELSISGCDLTLMKNVTFGEHSRLKYCCLSENELRNIDEVKFPQSVLDINLSRNSLLKIPASVKKLGNLKVLNLSTNFIRTAIYEFQTSSIEVLDLSFNHMKKLKLQFPLAAKSRLQSINLNMNELAEFDLHDIGHDPQTRLPHTRLREIDLSCNDLLKSAQLESFNFKASLPSSLLYLMTSPGINNDNGAPAVRIGHHYSTSILSSSSYNRVLDHKSYDARDDIYLCDRKRIDYPSSI
ncbi:uncharacterized protein LODBEIA_P23970 [Lodderomyces beijingensis]|uniref:F-box domain-containing protein n=1 Tax=Lodderomyces beijingensis TaxID=1775926 RepID=A0ABP0ZJ53_9ASCO